jgi:hypothetical protein
MKRSVWTMILLLGAAVAFSSCAGMHVQPTESNFKAPVVKLDSIQLSYWEGFWTYGKAKVTKGKAPKFGGSSPVTVEFVFEITNPNNFPVNLTSAQFFLYFEDYELRVVNDSNTMWIPSGKTNMKSMHVTLTATTTWAKFLLAGKELALKRGDDPWKKVEKWWMNLPDMSFPIDLKEGAFSFEADGLVKVVPINIRYP